MRPILLAVALIAACCTVPAQDPQLRVEAQLNVWRVLGTTGNGSATPVFVDEDEVWFLTAGHMLPSTSWVVEDRFGRQLIDGTVLSEHPSEDALLLLFMLPEDALPIHAHRLSFAPLELGALVYGSGFAGGQRHQWLTLGLVSSVDGRVTSPIAPGDSGGGLFDPQGRLIGILVARWSRFDAHLGQVVPLSVIQDWLEPMLG